MSSLLIILCFPLLLFRFLFLFFSLIICLLLPCRAWDTSGASKILLLLSLRLMCKFRNGKCRMWWGNWWKFFGLFISERSSSARKVASVVSTSHPLTTRMDRSIVIIYYFQQYFFVDNYIPRYNKFVLRWHPDFVSLGPFLKTTKDLVKWPQCKFWVSCFRGSVWHLESKILRDETLGFCPLNISLGVFFLERAEVRHWFLVYHHDIQGTNFQRMLT